MSQVSIIAYGAVSALGLGPAAFAGARAGEAARCAIARDEELAAAGLARPAAARAPAELGEPILGDRATALLGCSLRQLCTALDERLAGWRELRLGVALGTSSGGMLSAERFFAAARADQALDAALARPATYFAPVVDALRSVGIFVDDGAGGGPCVSEDVAAGRGAARRVCPCKVTQVLAACASSTVAIGLGMRWLTRGACDLVLAGGYDALSLFVAAGFEAIRATTASTSRPFRVGRDGMSLGEGAGVVALVRGGAPASELALAQLTGFGCSCDAVHITAPDRTGAGLIRAAQAALRDAGEPGPIQLVSAHATSTPYNDAMEALAIRTACGAQPDPVVQPFKAQIGHALGAAGVLELLAAVDALSQQVAPAACGDGELDPDARVRLLARAEPATLERALKLSAAFGGVTAALVVERHRAPRAPRPLRPVHLHSFAHVDGVDREQLSQATGIARDRLARLDELAQLGLGAMVRLRERCGVERLAGAGIVMGHALATIDVNARFDERLRSRGPRSVDPRLFPATTPNAAAGHCAIAFGLTGPSLTVGAGLGGGLEALTTGVELVAAGDADRMVVLAADDAGPFARRWLELCGLSARRLAAGATAALLVAGEPAEALGEALPLDGLVDHGAEAVGQLGLREWLQGWACHG